MSKRIYVAILIIAAMGVLAGCGGVTVKRLADAKSDEKGLRFYRPVPYMQVTMVPKTKDGKPDGADIQAKLVYLPNFDEQYVATFDPALFGSMEGSANLADGWNLTSVNQKETSGFATSAEAIAGVVKAAGGPAIKAEQPQQVRVLLFRFDGKTFSEAIELRIPPAGAAVGENPAPAKPGPKGMDAP